MAIGCDSNSSSGGQGKVPLTSSISSQTSSSSTITNVKPSTASVTPSASKTSTATTTPKPTALTYSLEIELPSVLETVETLMFRVKPAVPLDQLPQNSFWKWDFGDGTPGDTKVGRTEPYLTTGHSFTKNGDYQVRVSLIDQDKKQEVGSATKRFIISDITAIKRINYLELIYKISGLNEYTPPTSNYYDFVMRNMGGGISLKQWTLEWCEEWRSGSEGGWRGDEIKFKGTYTSSINSDTGIQNKQYAISGMFFTSPEFNGLKLSNFTYEMLFDNPNYKGTANMWRFEYYLELKDIFLSKVRGGTNPWFQYRTKGYEQVYNYTKSASYFEHFPDNREIEWSPQPRENLTDSALEFIFDVRK